jgi:hypothetical protein
VKHKTWPDYPSSDDLLYLGSRAKAIIFDWPKNSLLQEQSEHFLFSKITSCANLYAQYWGRERATQLFS